MFAPAWPWRGTEGAGLAQVTDRVLGRSELRLRGLISALAWGPSEPSLRWLARWLEAGADPVLRVAALRVLALMDQSVCDLAKPHLPRLLDSPHGPLRAAACRLAGRFEGSASTRRPARCHAPMTIWMPDCRSRTLGQSSTGRQAMAPCCPGAGRCC